jgi:hypothetical protein
MKKHALLAATLSMISHRQGPFLTACHLVRMFQMACSGYEILKMWREEFEQELKNQKAPRKGKVATVLVFLD